MKAIKNEIFKNENIIVATLSIIIIVATIAPFLFSYHVDSYSVDSLSDKNLEVKLETKKTSSKEIKVIFNGPSYNYTNLLNLINKYRKFERAFYSDFEVFIKNTNNFYELQDILEEFRHERINFRKYLNKVKAFHNQTIPTRKKQALRYYFKILETSISEIEEMLEKIKLN